MVHLKAREPATTQAFWCVRQGNIQTDLPSVKDPDFVKT